MVYADLLALHLRRSWYGPGTLVARLWDEAEACERPWQT